MSVPVTIKVSREIVDLAEKMVRFGIARSRSHAINLMIRHGIDRMRKEVEFWEGILNEVKELERKNYKIEHGGLSRILREGREEP